MKASIRTTGLIVALCAVAASGAQTSRVTGTVTYRERMPLSSAAVVEIRLEDVTRAGVVPAVVARARINRPGQVPVAFELPFDARAIDSRGRYAVRAVISDGGVELFASLDTVLVLTQGHGSRADLVLTRVGTAKPQPPRPPARPQPQVPPQPLLNLPAAFVGTPAATQRCFVSTLSNATRLGCSGLSRYGLGSMVRPGHASVSEASRPSPSVTPTIVLGQLVTHR